MAITVQELDFGSGDPATVSFATAPSEGDFILIMSMNSSGGTHSIPSGFTALYNDSTTSGFDRTVSFCYKIAGASESNSYSTEETDSGTTVYSQGIYYRADSGEIEFDVTYVEGDHLSLHIATINPTNDPITTNTDDALVILALHTTEDWDSGEITAAGAPTNYTLRTGATSGFFLYADRVITSAGTETPGAWNNTGTNGSTDCHTFTIAIREKSSVVVPVETHGKMRKYRQLKAA